MIIIAGGANDGNMLALPSPVYKPRGDRIDILFKFQKGFGANLTVNDVSVGFFGSVFL